MSPGVALPLWPPSNKLFDPLLNKSYSQKQSNQQINQVEKMDVKIIGGGIIGTYLAKKLGEGTELWEKNEEVKRKTCGGLISKTGLQSLNLPYKKAIMNEVKGAKIKAGERQLTISKEETQAYVLDMKKMKKKLRKQAVKKGVELKTGKTWKPKKKNNEKILIGADGAISQVAKEKSFINQFYSTYQIITEAKVDSDYVELYMGKYTPNFFGWIIPLSKDKAKIGIGTFNKNPKKAFNEFLNSEDIQIDKDKVEREESAPIPIFDSSKKIVGRNWALVGDAAGQNKATTGGGVVIGCKSAENLSEAIEEKNLKSYIKKQKKINKDLKTHLKIRKYLNRTDKERLIEKMNRKDADKIIEKYGDMDHPEKLKKEILKRPRFWLMGLDYLIKNKK